MANKGTVFDNYMRTLVIMLLRNHATENADSAQYDARAKLSFDTANNALVALNSMPVPAKPWEEKK